MSYIEKLAQEIHSEVSPHQPLDEGDRALYLMYALLALVLGEEVTAENVHDAWSAWKAMDDPGHRSLRPFEELSSDIQDEDLPYVEAIRRVARRLTPGRV